MAFIQTGVPLVFWGQRPPSHEITCLCRTEDKKGIATASLSGQICLWDILKERDTERIKLRAKCMLFGGQSAVVSLCFIKNWTGDRDCIASLSEKGTISLWDGKDGACLKFVTRKGHHSGIKSLPRAKSSETLIALHGQYSDVFIMDSITLDLLCRLKASHNPNWVGQLCFLSNIDRKDALLALTVDGVAKLWMLPSRNEMRELEEVVEDRSINLPGSEMPLSLVSHCHGNHCAVLAVFNHAWQIFDTSSGKMKALLIYGCEQNIQGWMCGEFADYKTVVVWAVEDGRAFVYRLAQRCVPGMEALEDSVDNASTSGCLLLFVLGVASPAHSPAVYLDKYWHLQGDRSGRLYLWDIRKIREHALSGSHSHIPILPDCSCCIADSWEPPALPCGLTDMLYPQQSAPPPITCALYLSSFGRLVCGQTDGSIAVISGTQAATVLMLQPRKFSRGWPQHCVMRGHKGAVKCLLHPASYSRAYASDHLLSGGADFTVKLWDLYAGVLVHTFAVHGGEVANIISCPPEINPRLQTCVCSIAQDYSVAILSTTERKCLLVAACHSSPVDNVQWRLHDDFLLVYCTDGKLYVWQVETGSLDRCVEGETARTIFKNAPDYKQSLLLPSSVPLTVRSLRVSPADSLIQVLLFNPETLVNRLSRMERPEEVPKQPRPKKQFDAFKNYSYGRWNLSSQSPSARSARRTSMPVAFEAPQPVAMATPTRVQERAREVLGQGVANQSKPEQIQEESPGTIVDIVRLLLSCLHAWNLDEALDRQCEEILGLVRPSKPVSFGLLSRGGCMSLVMPGFGVRSKPQRFDSVQLSGSGHETARSGGEEGGSLEDLSAGGGVPIPIPGASLSGSVGAPPGGGGVAVPGFLRQSSTSLGFTFDQKYHVRWQLSRSLTTQHLLTMVSITNTLMNQSVGAHALASTAGLERLSSGEDDSDEESEDSATQKDNLIRAIWSQVAALHCVMLPERMEGKFRPPHLPVLASRFLDPCQAIREAAQALLQAELRRIKTDGRHQLVQAWVGRLHPQTTPIRSSSAPSSSKHPPAQDETDSYFFEAIPTQQQQATALIILGMIGAEFHSEEQSAKRRTSDHIGSARKGAEGESMDPNVARLTAKALQNMLLEKPHAKSPLYSNLRCSSAELLGRGFQLWEKYVDIPQVVMGLLDMVIQYCPEGERSEVRFPKARGSSSKSAKFASEVARKALNLMIILRPVTIVTTLAKEVATYLASQHVTHFPHSSLQPVQVGVTPPPSTSGIVTPSTSLLPSSKEEILDLMRTVVEKCSQQVALQLLEVVDVALYCLDHELLKKRNLLMEVLPSLARMPNVSYSSKSKRLAVGARSGQVGIYDLKQGRTQMITPHKHAVTVLMFSDDGKLLAMYAYGDSALSVWQVGSSLLGGVISQTPKCLCTWPAISSVASGTYSHFIRLEWAGSRSVILHMPGGVECKYSL